MHRSLPIRFNPLTTLNVRHIGHLLMRFWYEYRQIWKTVLLRDLMDRLLYLFAFGFGMGALVKTMDGLPYLTFLVPGIAASTGVFVMTMAMTFGVWERSSSSRIWAAWLATPIRLPEILLTELVYAALRTLPSIFILILLAGFWLKAIPSFWGTLAALPVLFLANLAMGAVALCFTAHIRRTMHFSYVNTLWTTPMFLFSGVFFDLNHAPVFLKAIAFCLPLSHVLGSVRPLMAGLPLHPLTLLTHILILAILFLGGYRYALWRFQRRLMD